MPRLATARNTTGVKTIAVASFESKTVSMPPARKIATNSRRREPPARSSTVSAIHSNSPLHSAAAEIAMRPRMKSRTFH